MHLILLVTAFRRWMRGFGATWRSCRGSLQRQRLSGDVKEECAVLYTKHVTNKFVNVSRLMSFFCAKVHLLSHKVSLNVFMKDASLSLTDLVC